MTAKQSDPVEAFVAHVGLTEEIGFFRSTLALLGAEVETREQQIAAFTAAFLACTITRTGLPGSFAQYAAQLAMKRVLEQTLEDAVIVVDGTLAALPFDCEAGFKPVNIETLSPMSYDDYAAATQRVTQTTVLHTGNLCKTVVRFLTKTTE